MLAATTIIRIGWIRKTWTWPGVDFGGASAADQGAFMKQQLKAAGLAVFLSFSAHGAVAQEKLKIGVIVTLSGPAAALGQQVRDGFALAVKDLGGKMAGRDVEVVVADDELKPDGAVSKVKGLLERDKVDFVVGPIFSNILQAIHKPVTDTRTFLISPNAGPSSYAGKNCSPFFYVTSYQNDQVHEILGKVAQDRGYKRVYVLVPNYQAGKDSAAGFKLDYKGEIVEESYTPLGTLDFQVELSKIASLKPDALFTFMPGGMGVGLVKQYSRPALPTRFRFCLRSRSMNRRCRRSRMRRSACSAVRTGRPISTIHRTRSSSPALRPPTTSCPAPMRSRPMMRRC
jgi:ABC-type branched-subunit amino acid transport system substrate-binding protein